MNRLKNILLGGVLALASFGIIVGGLSLSLAEGSVAKINPSPTIFIPTPTMPFHTPFIRPSEPSPLATETPTLPPTPVNCPPPAGWVPITIQTGQTLDQVAATYQVTVEALMQANCLVTGELMPGSILYVPPTPTTTRAPCEPPPGWIAYTIQRGDTLFSLSEYYGVTVAELQAANCMGTSTLLVVGDTLYVPNMPTRTPYVSPTFVSPPTDIPTETPSETPFEIPTEIPSETPTEIPTETPSETPVSSNP